MIRRLLAVVDGRNALLEESETSSFRTQGYLADRFRGLRALPAFMDALAGPRAGDAASQERLARASSQAREIVGLCRP